MSGVNYSISRNFSNGDSIRAWASSSSNVGFEGFTIRLLIRYGHTYMAGTSSTYLSPNSNWRASFVEHVRVAVGSASHPVTRQ